MSNITSSNKAFMIRNDGTIFPVKVHYYGNPSVEDAEETIYASEWLFNHTNHSSTKQIILEFLHSWIYVLCDEKVLDASESELLTMFYDEIDDRNYKFLTKDFVQTNIKQIKNAKIFYDIDSFSNLNRLINEELNQEFLRARYGGMYDSSTGSREMVFRISSANFNWFDIIWNFVYNNKNFIDTVTIVSDYESTGRKQYYKEKGIVFNQVPINDFLTLSGNPVFERYKSKQSIVECYNNSCNRGLMLNRYQRIRDNEIRKEYE